MINFRIRAERLRARAEAIRTRAGLLRAAWLAGVPIIGMAAIRLFQPARALAGAEAEAGTAAAPAPLWPWLCAAGIAFGLAYTVDRRRRGARDVLRELDRSFGLGDLLVTADEVDRRGARSALERRLLEDGASAIARFGGERALSDIAVRIEREALLGVAMVALGLFVLGEARRVPPQPDRLPPIDLPAAVGAGAGPAARSGTGSDGAAGSTGSGELPGADGLGRAFGANAAGSSVADALGRGDARSASRAIRDLADRIDEVSPAGRRALGEAIEAAAAQAGWDAELGRAAQAAGESLQREGRGEGADEGLAGLAAALDALAGRGPRAGPTPALVERRGPELPRLDGAGTMSEPSFGTRPGGRVERSAAGRTTPGAVRAAGDDNDAAELGDRASEVGAGAGAAFGTGGAAGSAAGLAPELRPIVLRYFASDGGTSR